MDQTTAKAFSVTLGMCFIKRTLCLLSVRKLLEEVQGALNQDQI